jgi:ATP-binding cassette subfamily F protein uup
VALLLNAQDLSQSYGAVPLFRKISLNVSEGERLGLIGPNGSGKSTLLEILAGRREPDEGQVALRRNTRLAFVAQVSTFVPNETVSGIIERALKRAHVPPDEHQARLAETLGRTGFSDFQAEAASLSGGWRKRLAIAEALVADPDLLLLDEPTNHLDLAGIEWLEKLLLNAPFASVVVSHDRYFLENVATDMLELNRMYPDGLLRVRGNYSTFLDAKDDFLVAQTKRQEALENRVRTEIAWLRRGPKARATKAKARIDNAQQLIGELNDLNARTRTASADIDFTATERKTKRLIELKNVSYGFEGRPVIEDVSFTLTAGVRVGLVGPNGSGKTTLLRLLRGELEPQSGEVTRADALRIMYFDQNRPLDESLTLRRALAPDSDSVVYQDRTLHVASWASRFLFTNEQLNQPVSRLSGGERARVLIARLMLEPADVLLLDEPTNDLDIPTLEILEESLLEFGGALVLVTHDRFMLDRVSTVVMGLDGQGNAQRFADYEQWDAWLQERRTVERTGERLQEVKQSRREPTAKKKLSYLDSRDFETIEDRITEAEVLLQEKRSLLADPDVVRDAKRLQDALSEADEAQKMVDALYARWAELEAKIS